MTSASVKLILNNYSMSELKLIISELKLKKELVKNYSSLKKEELINELAGKLTLCEAEGISTLSKLSEVNYKPLAIRIDEKPKKQEKPVEQAATVKPRAKKAKVEEVKEEPKPQPQPEPQPVEVKNKKVKQIVKQIEEVQQQQQQEHATEKKTRTKKSH